jgi:hypothetical protein
MDEKKDYWQIYNAIESSIKFADTKAMSFIGIIGIILTILQKRLVDILKLPPTNSIKILCVISVVLLIGSVICSILCLYPQKSKTEKNAFYYKSIAKNFDEERYCEYLNEISNETFDKQLSIQIYQLATVCDKKYKFVKWSLWFFISGIAFLILLLFYL